jgi:hypothetical protein
LLKDGENRTRRIARLELGGERMCEEVVLRTFLVFVQCVVDDKLEVRGRGVGKKSVRLCVRHEEENGQFLRAREKNGEFVGDRAEGTTLRALHCPVGVRRYCTAFPGSESCPTT